MRQFIPLLSFALFIYSCGANSTVKEKTLPPKGEVVDIQHRIMDTIKELQQTILQYDQILDQTALSKENLLKKYFDTTKVEGDPNVEHPTEEERDASERARLELDKYLVEEKLKVLIQMADSLEWELKKY